MEPLGFLGIDQYGEKYVLTSKYPRKELSELFNTRHIDKIYRDDKNGKAICTGYILRGLWIELYNVSEWKNK